MTHMARMLHLGTAAHAVVWKLMLAAVFAFASWSVCAEPSRLQGVSLPARAKGSSQFPRLGLIARAEGSSQVGHQVPDFPGLDVSLRVPVGRRVTLDARVEDAYFGAKCLIAGGN